MSSETSLPWLVQNKPSAPIRRVENKVEFLERQFHSEKLSFVHKKETEHSFELSLSTCVFYQRIFNLEMQNFSLENHHIMIARQPFSTLDARGFSCAVSGFGQVSKSDPREKPLDQSAISLIAPGQLQPRLYQNIQNLDVLLIGSLEISNVSNTLIGLQSQ